MARTQDRVDRRLTLGNRDGDVERVAGHARDVVCRGSQRVPTPDLVDTQVRERRHAIRRHHDRGPRQPRVVEQAAVVRERDGDRAREALYRVPLIVYYGDLHRWRDSSYRPQGSGSLDYE